MSNKGKVSLVVLACVIGSNLFLLQGEASAAPKNAYLGEAKRLAAVEKQYVEDRVHGNWQGIYAIQHPDFKKKVSFEEFQFHDGRVVHNYRDDPIYHISGGIMPSLAHVRSNPGKKDMLGNPQARIFRWFPNPFITIQSHTLKKISLSENKKFAMVEVELKGREKLNPALVRDHIEFDTNKAHVDYWEKVGGEWRIALLADASSISGGSKVPYFIPNSNAAWEKMKFVEVSADQITPNR